MSKNIIDALKYMACDILPSKAKETTDRQLWKNDTELHKMIKERGTLSIGAHLYKIVTKNIKRRVNWLRNEKLRLEAEEINDEYAKK